ncbi:MAG: hypothetical protein JSV52_04100 [Candidatus Zixiibacteriota bacterium]|nr:MAG: hypothetical protein JSV52_04100 [candidate division Zixibacteria bacterium]
MFCANCSEKILGEAIKQGGEFFCGYECASLAAGVDPDEASVYFEEDESVDDFFGDLDE